MLFTVGIYTDCSLLLFCCSYVVVFLCVDFFNFVHLLREFCKSLVVLFDELIFIYGPVVCLDVPSKPVYQTVTYIE